MLPESGLICKYLVDNISDLPEFLEKTAVVESDIVLDF